MIVITAHAFYRSETLVAGNVITIEPGCYVPSDPSYPKHFHGLGVRIEVRRHGPGVCTEC